MASDSQFAERRRHPRYEVKDLVIAVPNKSTAQVGRIVNISKGGMAVRYLEQSDWLENAESMDILLDGKFFMTNLPIESICDFKVDSQVSFCIINEHQSCLRFGDLTPGQEKLLDEFIMKYTAGSS